MSSQYRKVSVDTHFKRLGKFTSFWFTVNEKIHHYSIIDYQHLYYNPLVASAIFPWWTELLS